ncbi:kinase-like domain-containing protein [Trametes meyenii]|nr:kinase-like domain-containing protein [Trametes meyenii]
MAADHLPHSSSYTRSSGTDRDTDARTVFSDSHHEVTLNPDAVNGITFVCEEEPHMIKHSSANGYMSIQLGQRLHERFTIVRKLAWAANSSVWLATVLPKGKPNPRLRCVAIKVLNANATLGEALKATWELEVNKKISLIMDDLDIEDLATSKHCIVVLFTFTEDSVHGTHLGLVYDPFGSSMAQLQAAQPLKSFSLRIVKRFVKQVLIALEFLHNEVGVVHSDVKLGNLLVKIDADTARIQSYLQASPSENYPTRYQSDLWEGPIITAKSQPLPNFGLSSTLDNLHVCLSDFGSAIPLEKIPSRIAEYTPALLRAPEQLLGGPRSTPIDIWAVGCMVFESLLGKELFNVYKTSTLTFEDVHVARMVEYLGPFPQNFLSRCSGRGKFFDNAGNLLRNVPPEGTSLECGVSKTVRTPQELQDTCRFIRRCLTVDPDRRPTATQLLSDPWILS